MPTPTPRPIWQLPILVLTLAALVFAALRIALRAAYPHYFADTHLLPALLTGARFDLKLAFIALAVTVIVTFITLAITVIFRLLAVTLIMTFVGFTVIRLRLFRLLRFLFFRTRRFYSGG